MQRCCERGAKSHRNLEDEEEVMTKKAIKELEIFVSQINILYLFSIHFFFSTILLYHFFSILFLPTTFTHTHTHDPRPLPTTHDPRHLATLWTGNSYYDAYYLLHGVDLQFWCWPLV